MRLVLLGSPVEQSRSPRIHRAALAACGLAGDYVTRSVDPEGFAAACAEILEGAIDGANVTMPYKVAAHRACHHLDADAAQAGAVNTLKRTIRGLTGWNTDVAALRSALAVVDGTPVVILGAGGAAAAAAVAATGRPVTVMARREEPADRLAAAVGAAVLGWAQPVRGAVVINATPLGMRGESLPEGVVESAAALIDLAYGPSETPAVAVARARGLPVVDGISLLVAQAAVAFEVWTGLTAPREVMERAARTPETLKAP